MFLLLNFFVLGFFMVSARRVDFYRKDYTYFEEYDAFYKLHSDGNLSSWNTAFLTCDDEGAQLFYPESNEEKKVVMKFQEMMPSGAASANEIFVGIHDKFSLGEYVNINGQPINITIENKKDASEHCVIMDIRTGDYKLGKCYTHSGFRPFICKKVADVTCPTIDAGYVYFKDTRKCYKTNMIPKTWSKAMETCFMEGGLLVVIESVMEAILIRNLLNDNTRYHAGFNRMLYSNHFYTVKGNKLEDSGYNVWYNNDEMKNDCGYIFDYKSKIGLGAYACDTELKPFVCEMSVEK